MLVPTSPNDVVLKLAHDMSDKEFFDAICGNENDFYGPSFSTPKPQKKFLGCEGCPYKCLLRTRDNPTLENGCKILIVVGKPSDNDLPIQQKDWKGKGRVDSSGMPIIGDFQRSEKWHPLKTYIQNAARESIDNINLFGMTTAVLCHDPNRRGGDDDIEAVRSCGRILREKIKRSKATVVLLMGRQACKALPNEPFSKIMSIDEVRGKIFSSTIDDRVVYYIPTQAIDDIEDDPTLWSTTLLDFEKAQRIAKEGFNKPPFTTLFKDYKYPKTTEEIKSILEPLTDTEKTISFDIETTGLNPLSPTGKVTVLSVSWAKGQAAAIDLTNADNEAWDCIKKFLESSTPKVAHNATFDIGYLLINRNIKVKNLVFDTMLTHYILDENRAGGDEKTVKGEYTLKKLVWDYLSEYGGYEEQEDVSKKLRSGDFENIKTENLLPYAACDADVTRQLMLKQIPPLLDLPFGTTSEEYSTFLEKNPKTAEERQGKYSLWWLASSHMPKSSYTAVTMERYGMYVDQKYLKEVSEKVNTLTVELKNDIENLYRKEKPDLNLNSASHVAWILFDKLGLVSNVKTKKKAPSSNKKAMLDIAAQLNNVKDPDIAHVVEQIQAYKALKTTNSLILKNLPSLIDIDGRVHPKYWLTGTVTGRLSCSEPNLQQIQSEIKFKLNGKDESINIKKIFAADPGYALISADYSQVEMCLLAALSGDPKIINAIIRGLDMHCFVASQVNKIPYEVMLNKAQGKYTDEQLLEFKKNGIVPPILVKDKAYGKLRSKSKAVGFGIVYGTTAKGLGDNLGISEMEADDLIQAFFTEFPSIKDYIARSHKEAERYGYVTTKFGRRRRFPIRFVRKRGLDNGSKRQAQNSKIQGSAFDVCMIACNELNERLPLITDGNLAGRLTTTVHDAIYGIVPLKKSCIQQGLDLFKTIMVDEAISEYSSWLNGVPIRIDPEVGLSWGEQMHPDKFLATL